MFESRNKPSHPGERAWIDHKRGGQTFSFSFDHRLARLNAELLEPNGEVLSIATVEFQNPRTMTQVMATVKEFTTAVMTFLADMPPDS